MDFVDKAASTTEVEQKTGAAAGGKSSTDAAPVSVIVCTTPGCGKPAILACPTCAKYGLPPALFCGQECFKGYWGTHKNIHALCLQKPAVSTTSSRNPRDMPEEFRGFRFTGNFHFMVEYLPCLYFKDIFC